MKKNFITLFLVGVLFLAPLMTGSLISMEKTQVVASQKQGWLRRLVSDYRRLKELRKKYRSIDARGELNLSEKRELDNLEKRMRRIRNLVIMASIIAALSSTGGWVAYKRWKVAGEEQARRAREEQARHAREEQERHAREELFRKINAIFRLGGINLQNMSERELLALKDSVNIRFRIVDQEISNITSAHCKSALDNAVAQVTHKIDRVIAEKQAVKEERQRRFLESQRRQDDLLRVVENDIVRRQRVIQSAASRNMSEQELRSLAYHELERYEQIKKTIQQDNELLPDGKGFLLIKLSNAFDQSLHSLNNMIDKKKREAATAPPVKQQDMIKVEERAARDMLNLPDWEHRISYHWYEILGFKSAPGRKEARHKYRELAGKIHPDLWHGSAKEQTANEAFQAVTQAASMIPPQ